MPVASHALVMSDDLTITDYQANADTSPFSATGGIYRNSGFTSSGVLVAPNVVVGAAHDPVNSSNGTFVINGQTYDIATAVRLDADNDTTDGRDVTLYTLTTNVSGVTPATIYSGVITDYSVFEGMTAYYTGLGDQGTGSSPPPDTNMASTPDEVLLVGTNVIDEAGYTFDTTDGDLTFADNVLFADFDDGPGGVDSNFFVGSSLNPSSLEVGLALGDSGGGLFVYNSDTMQYELLGTHSAVLNGFGYGQILASTAFTETDRSTILAAIPEPTTAFAFALPCLIAARRSRRHA